MLIFERWKIINIAIVLTLGVIFAFPNLFSEEQISSWPSVLPRDQINLGLDLQGGVHLLLEVGTDVVVQERLDGLVSEVRGALRGIRGEQERIGYTNLGNVGDAVTVRIRNPDQVPQALERINNLASPLTSALLTGGGQDLQISQLDEQRIEVRLTPQAVQEVETSAVSQSIEIVRRRIDELGTREPTIQRQGIDRIIVQVPGESDPQRILALLRTTAKMNFHMVDTTVTITEARGGRVPPGSILLPSEEPEEPFVLVYREAALTGDRLTNSQPSFDQQTGQPVVTFKFDTSGARRFAEISRDNVGRRFAIVLDNRVISAPRIIEPILGGSGQITGNFTVESANNLAILLRSGALPAPVTPLEQRSVGPDLGADSISAGTRAMIIGFGAVIVFMVVCYSLFGLFANVALILNIVIIVGALSLLGATLTLPGIAGIVLTVGMAVDANVLIFERIREEITAGKSPINAIEAGYSRALVTILDANITTFIAASILFLLGAGPVRGFAVTLAIGILTSVFTAFTVTRLIVATWLRRQRRPALPI